MKEWLIWFGRGAEKERAYTQLQNVQRQYGEQGERVIRLSSRTDLARRSAGSTRRAFEFVESAFVKVTEEYAHIGHLLAALEAGLAKGKVGDFAAAEAALGDLGPSMDQLERHLSTWEQTWQSTPKRIDQAAQTVAELRQRVEQAGILVGAPLPLSERLTNLEEHLEKIRQTLAAGNPIEANHMIDDLDLARERVADQISPYVSGAAAITQAEQEVGALREQTGGLTAPPGGVVAALAAAEALLSRLRPNLAGGKLEPFQQDLLQLQQHLAEARRALRA